MKPICCGDREDARRLLAASAEGISIEELNPVWLTLESVQRRGLVCAGVILNQGNGPTDLAQSTNETELRRLLAGINLVVIDKKTEPNLAEIFVKTERPDVFGKLTQT